MCPDLYSAVTVLDGRDRCEGCDVMDVMDVMWMRMQCPGGFFLVWQSFTGLSAFKDRAMIKGTGY